MWWERRFVQVAQALELHQSSVLLTGETGDVIMGNWIDDNEQDADYLKEARPVRAFREACAWSKCLQVPVYPVFWKALKQAFGPADPGQYEELSGAPDDESQFGDSLARPVHERAVRGERRARNEFAGWRASPSRQKRLWALGRLLRGRRMACPEPLQHISYTHPFLHRPLVEFMMTIPTDVVCRPGEPRRLMRSAFSNLLPNAVARRKSKGDYGAHFNRSLRPLAIELLKDVNGMQLVQRGWVDSNSARGRFTRLMHGLPCNEPQLRNIILLEYWLRERAARSHTSAPQIEVA
jgi:hypothetical protein